MIGYLDPQDSFIGYYTDDYNKVLSSPVPPNQAIVFVDLAHGMLYSKKMVGMTPMIQPYKLSLYYVEETKKPENPLDTIVAKLNAMEQEISALKEAQNESPATNAQNNIGKSIEN